MSEREHRPGEGENSSTEEEDLVVRSTKKVKTKDEEEQAEIVSMVLETQEGVGKDVNMDAVHVEGEMMQSKEGGDNACKQSYRDKLLNIS